MIKLVWFVVLVVAASLANSAPPLEDREKLYLLAVGYYRSGDCSKSRQLIDRCIEVSSTSFQLSFSLIYVKLLLCDYIYRYIIYVIFNGWYGLVDATRLEASFGTKEVHRRQNHKG